MKQTTAKRIAKLINHRNNLPNKLGEYQIFEGNYFYISINEGYDNEEILACAKVKKTAFYSYEIRHVAVNPKYENQGLGKFMVRLIEDYAKTKKIPMITATTTCDNNSMIHIFKKFNYNQTKDFINAETKHRLVLWTKFIESNEE